MHISNKSEITLLEIAYAFGPEKNQINEDKETTGPLLIDRLPKINRLVEFLFIYRIKVHNRNPGHFTV